MNALAFIILAALAGLGVGAALTGFFLKSKHAKQEEETKDRIKSMLREAELTAETIKKDRMLEAKEKFLKLRAEFDEEHNAKKNLIITNENKVKQLQQQVTAADHSRVRDETRRFRLDTWHSRPSPSFKMAHAIFPKEWWNAAPRDYDNAVIALRSLYSRNVDSGTKDVSIVKKFL
jgi:hypothetical protein